MNNTNDYILRLMVAGRFTPVQVQFVLDAPEPVYHINLSSGLIVHYNDGVWDVERTTDPESKLITYPHVDSESLSEETQNNEPDYEKAFKLACKYLQKGYIDAEDRRGWSVMDWEIFILKKMEDENAG